MNARANQAEVRNPLLALPSARQLQDFLVQHPELAAHLRALLGDLKADCATRAQKCWTTHKAPMAAYWKACSVYAGHARKLTKGK